MDYKSELKSYKNYLTNHTKSKSHHQLYMALRHIHTYPFESGFKKPGACRPVAGVRLV